MGMVFGSGEDAGAISEIIPCLMVQGTHLNGPLWIKNVFGHLLCAAPMLGTGQFSGVNIGGFPYCTYDTCGIGVMVHVWVGQGEITPLG